MSAANDALQAGLAAVGLFPEAEYRFTPSRLWRLDFAFPEIMLAIELDGSGAGHNSDKGIRGDAEKRNAALEMTWRVLKYPSREVTVKKRLPRIVAQIERVVYGEADPDLFSFVLERDPDHWYKPKGKALWRRKNAEQLSELRQLKKDQARKRANEKARQRRMAKKKSKS